MSRIAAGILVAILTVGSAALAETPPEFDRLQLIERGTGRTEYGDAYRSRYAISIDGRTGLVTVERDQIYPKVVRVPATKSELAAIADAFRKAKIPTLPPVLSESPRKVVSKDPPAWLQEWCELRLEGADGSHLVKFAPKKYAEWKARVEPLVKAFEAVGERIGNERADTSIEAVVRVEGGRVFLTQVEADEAPFSTKTMELAVDRSFPEVTAILSRLDGRRVRGRGAIQRATDDRGFASLDQLFAQLDRDVVFRGAPDDKSEVVDRAKRGSWVRIDREKNGRLYAIALADKNGTYKDEWDSGWIATSSVKLGVPVGGIAKALGGP